MKFAISVLLSALVALACGLYLPWWSIAAATFLIAILVVQRPLAAFLSGFVSLFLLWLIIAANINSSNESVLAIKVSTLMGLGNSAFILILITAILGAVVGGMGALSGSLFARLIYPTK